MTLLFVDGFDHYATADIAKKWTTITGAPAVGSSYGRRATSNGMRLSNGQAVKKAGLPAAGTYGCGVAMRFANFAAAGNILAIGESGTVHMAVKVETSGALSILRGTTTLATTGSALSTNTFYYVELKSTVHDTAGSYDVRVNGASVLSATGVDTRNAGTGILNEVTLACPNVSTIANDVDDFYVLDSSGTALNDLLGDVRIDAIYPNGAGTHQLWTPSTGTDHAALIDETAPNTTDYLTGGAAGSKETATLQDLSVNGAILAVQVNAALAKTDAGACTTKNLIRSGTTEANGPVFAPSTTYLYSSSIHETDPATGSAWLTAAINALEAGVEVVS